VPATSERKKARSDDGRTPTASRGWPRFESTVSLTHRRPHARRTWRARLMRRGRLSALCVAARHCDCSWVGRRWAEWGGAARRTVEPAHPGHTTGRRHRRRGQGELRSPHAVRVGPAPPGCRDNRPQRGWQHANDGRSTADRAGGRRRHGRDRRAGARALYESLEALSAAALGSRWATGHTLPSRGCSRRALVIGCGWTRLR
jgi:hypothetical protein